MKAALNFFATKYPSPAQTPGGRVALPSMCGSADAFLALSAAGDNSTVLVVTPGLPDADRILDDLKILSATLPHRILELAPPLADDRRALGTRLKTVAAVKALAQRPYPAVIVASSQALASPVSQSAPAAVVLAPAAEVSSGPAAIAERLAALGYRRVSMVGEIGDFAIRGGILDAWGPDEEFPVRAEFFGDELESLRRFDPALQTSIEAIARAELAAVSGEEEQGGKCLFTDLLPADAIVIALEHYRYPLASFFSPGRTLATIFTGEPAPEGVPSFPLRMVTLPGFAELGADEAHHPELFDAARRRLERHLEAEKKRGARILKLDELSGGFELFPLIVVTKADRVFTKRRRIHRGESAAAAGARVYDVDDLDPGEYVVHVDHGVGRYIGSREILSDGKRVEVFTLEYADGARLHVPAVHAHLLSRYVGVKGEAVKLHRLDGRKWSKDKADAQKAVADLAVSLLETQARREAMPGFAYDVAPDGRAAFDAAFPYEETPDQLAAIAAIEKDLALRRPMDRLLCGDAGYGKTEVAMRAAYIAAMNGKQVAVLAPTTVLAEQHFETFTSRFDGTPIRIESMSRFQSAAVHEGTFKRIASGACDIVIGTHALLSSHLNFHDLGLIIIDEEQRFGVRHKEFLKALRATADVLTMSATPIPRTLYLSMTGARDLSLLRSPPRDRVSVETRIVTAAPELIRNAIEAELARGGQVFFLHNRVSTIHQTERMLKELVPKVKIVVAHGQMDASTLARKMRAFEAGEFDLLLSTTIIESGIDIPRANTILVDQAQTFGLADLYQLRGRVGRSTRQGHAVFLLPCDGLVDAEARERLDALRRHDGLGAGFNLAMRDLELRGAGNLLGAQQSGHIAAVGFGLYCQLLQRTVAALKGEKPKEVADVRVNLDFLELSPNALDSAAAAAFPYDYINEDALRMSMMKRLAQAMDMKELARLRAELKDRFGPLPPPANRLLKMAELRIRCAAAGFSRVDTSERRAVFYRAGGREIALVIDFKEHSPDRRLAELIKAIA